MDDIARTDVRDKERALAEIDYAKMPAILLFCDQPDRRRQLAEAIRLAGGRVSAALPLAGAPQRIADHAAPDGVVVDFGEEAGASAELLLDALEHGALNKRFLSVALISVDLIDAAFARASHADIQLLCAADGLSLASALASLVVDRGTMLNDVSAETGALQLRALSEEVGRIARTLAALSNNGTEQRALFRGELPERDREPVAAIDAGMIRSVIRARRLRDQFFGPEIFADPAWDMLLDLMAAQLEGQAVAVSSLCIAAAVPPTTALRWIKTLTELGLFVRIADPRDRRRIFIELAPRAAEAILNYFSAARRITPLIN